MHINFRCCIYLFVPAATYPGLICLREATLSNEHNLFGFTKFCRSGEYFKYFVLAKKREGISGEKYLSSGVDEINAKFCKFFINNRSTNIKPAKITKSTAGADGCLYRLQRFRNFIKPRTKNS